MNESRMPAGYVPLTVHQVGTNGNGRSNSSSRGDNGSSSSGGGHSRGRENAQQSKGPRAPRNVAKIARGEQHPSTFEKNGPRRARPRNKVVSD